MSPRPWGEGGQNSDDVDNKVAFGSLPVLVICGLLETKNRVSYKGGGLGSPSPQNFKVDDTQRFISS